ncbi:MAG: ABC transporter permease [Deltaproteobacteria bacterium]|nr:ABC transporter permease [Deltaproteobacteria bacterium]MBW2532206.1 ABC transporter permease [Deltaproteobacteria bacterium]
MNTFKMAWRNAWRNRRRTVVNVAATTIALFVTINYAGLVEGYLAAMEDNVLDLEMADAQIHAEGYRNDPSLYKKIDEPDKLLAALDAAGFRSTARLMGGGLAAGGDTSAGVMLRGIDVERDATVSEVNQHVSDGQWLDGSDDRGVVIGMNLAKTLNVEPGSEVVVLTQGFDGSMANQVYQVRGILRSMGGGINQAGMFMTEQAFRELLVFPEGAHQIMVRKPADMSLPAAVERIRALAPDEDVKSWRELSPMIAQYVDNAKGIVNVMFFIIYVAIGILILNTMLMAVFERVREIGVLKALGVGPRKVVGLVYAETAIQTGLAVLVGSLLSLPLLGYLSAVGIDTGRMSGMSIGDVAWDSTWHARISVDTFRGPILMLLFVVAFATLYPAIKAAFIKPVEAMRHQ